MIAAKLRNYNETVRCVIQNEIMNVLLNANRGLYERYNHTHLQPINPPQAHFPSGPSKMYLQSIVLKTLLRHQSLSTIIQFCLTVFPQEASRQLQQVQKKY